MNEINLDQLASYSTRQLKELHQELFGSTPSSNNKSYLLRKIQKQLLETNPLGGNSPPTQAATTEIASPVSEGTSSPTESPAEAHNELAVANSIAPVAPVVSDVIEPAAELPTVPTAEPAQTLIGEEVQQQPVAPSEQVLVAVQPKPKRTRKSFRAPGTRDPRLPPAGTVLKREFKGSTYSVKILEEGFEFAGKQWNSLSGIAKEITGIMWNGLLFWGLTPPPARPSTKMSAKTLDGPVLDQFNTR